MTFETILDTIKNAIRGKDVRQAIYEGMDRIKKLGDHVNTEMEKHAEIINGNIQLRNLNGSVTGNTIHLVKSGTNPSFLIRVDNALILKNISNLKMKFKLKNQGCKLNKGIRLNLTTNEGSYVNVDENCLKIEENDVLYECEFSHDFNFNDSMLYRNIKILFLNSISGDYDIYMYDLELYIDGVLNNEWYFGDTNTEAEIKYDESRYLASKEYVKKELEHYKANMDSVSYGSLTDENKLILTGNCVEEQQMTYSHTGFQNFHKVFAVVNKKLPPCIVRHLVPKPQYSPNYNDVEILILDKIGLNCKILDKYEINSFDKNDLNIIVPNGGYVAYRYLDSRGETSNISYGTRTDNMPKTELFSIFAYDDLEIGSKVDSKYYTKSWNSTELIIVPLPFLGVKKEVDTLKKVNQMDGVISTNPAENLRIFYKQDFKKTDDKWRFDNIETLENGGLHFSGYGRAYYDIYQVFDEWEIRAKVRLNDLTSVFGFSSVSGEWEAGSIVLDVADNGIKWVKSETTSGTLGTVDSSDETDFDFEVGNYYIVQLKRHGLEMTFMVYDVKNGKKLSFTKKFSRFHGSLGFVTVGGDLDLLTLELKLGLYDNAKALIVGDSITEGLSMGTDDISKRWASLLRDNYFKGSAVVCGRGWGTSADALSIIENTLKYGYRFKYVMVMIGTNERTVDKIESWKTNIVCIYDTIVSSGAIPIIVTPPLGSSGVEYIQEMRDFIISKGWDTVRMDLATSINNDGQTFDSSLSTDGTHFNAKGNQAMYDRAMLDLEIM